MINSPAFEEFARRYEEGLRAGLTAVAYAYQGAVKEKLMHGYTTGNFSHGGAGVAGTVTVGAIESLGEQHTISVGTNTMYAMFWELGFVSIFTRRYERVEYWRETLEEKGADMAATFGRVFAAVSGGLAAPDIQLYAADSPYQGPDPARGFGGFK